MKNRILILGGYGRTGRIVAELLLAHTGVEVVVAGRRPERAEALASELGARHGPGRVRARRLDAADGAGLVEAFREVDLVVVASSTPQHVEAVAGAALEAGCDHLDVQLDRHRLATLRFLAPRIEARGRTFITEAGFHPGLPSALVRLAAGSMERVRTARVWALVRMDPSGFDEMPDSIDELVRAFRQFEPLVHRGGRWRRPRLAWLWPYRRGRFPEPFGARLCVPLFFPELEDLPRLVPGLEEVAFYMAGFGAVADLIVTPAILAALLVAGERAVRPAGRVFFRTLRLTSRPPYGTVMRLEAEGMREGRPARLETLLSHPDEYVFTAAPVVAALRQYLDGTIRRPGLTMMGHAVEPGRLLEDVAAMGISVETRTTVDDE